MIIIGVDPHTSMHTANAVDAAANKTAGSLQIDASLPGYRRLLRWAGQFGERRWAVENARGLGRHLAQWLAARGEQVVDVPSTATARVRELSRGGRRKNDVIDAAAAAAVAVLQGDATPVLAEDTSTVLALLDERRNNVITQRTRLVNQLHALLRDLLPGGARTNLTAAAAAQLLARVRPAGPVEIGRKQLARDLVAEIRKADRRLKTLTRQIGTVVAETGSRRAPFTLAHRANIALLTGRCGDAVRALRLFRGLLPDKEQALGSRHPYALATRAQIASWTGECRDVAGALQLYRDLLPDTEQALGSRHPETLTIRAHIASWTGRRGNATRALQLYQDLLPDMELALGPRHPETLTVRGNIARWTRECGDAARALHLYRALMPDMEQVFGPRHPGVLHARAVIARLSDETRNVR